MSENGMRRHHARNLGMQAAMAAAGTWLQVTSAFAQEAAPAPAASAPSPAQLQTVMITADRKVENIKNVPVSASTISDDTLNSMNSGAQDMQMLMGRAPSLMVESTLGRALPRFYLRGYGNVDFRQNASQPVSMVYDDVVQEAAALKGFPAFDLEGLEVLRGPQGTLFGRNTPAGVIKFSSVKPQREFGGYVSLSEATYNTASAEGAVNMPLNKDLAARVSVIGQHRDGWIGNSYTHTDNQYGGFNDGAARFQLLYKPSADVSALLNLHGRTMDGSGSLTRANIIQKGTNDLVAGFDVSKIEIDGQRTQNLRNAGGSLNVEWKRGDLVFHSITGYEKVRLYSRGDVDGGHSLPTPGPGTIPFAVESADGTSGHHQLTEELRVESDVKGPFNWQAGLYFFNEKYRIDSYSYATLSGGALTSDIVSEQTNNAWAAFGSAKYDIDDRLNIRGGLRYTSDRKSLVTNPANLPSGGSSLITTAGLAADTASSKVTWDISPVYKLTADANLYGRIATGFRGATIQPAATANPMSVAKPETITSYEVGVKTDLLNRRARLSFDLYHYDIKDQQLTAVGGNANQATLLNAKKAIGQGAEMDLQAYVIDNVLLTFGGAYNFTKLKDPSLAVAVCRSCTVLNPTTVNAAGTTLALIDGNSQPEAPRWTANFTARYSIPTTIGEFYAFTDWVYRSEVQYTLYKSVEYVGKPLLTGGLRLGYKWDQDKYEVALFGRNITNRIQLVGGIDFNNLAGYVNDYNPRIFGLQFRANF